MMEFPIFITSFNRLEYLKKLISWLDKIEYPNVIILDNCSKYQPLIDYYKQIQDKYKIVFLPDNYSHLAVWRCGLFNEILNNSYYIVTDPDISPIDECPSDAVDFFYQILQQEKSVTKVGFSLKVDDIPDCYYLKAEVIKCESKFYNITSIFKNINIYHSIIDTTFALYRPGIFPDDTARWHSGIRTGYPYQARHLTWYRDSSANQTEEDIIYLNSSKVFCAGWSRDSKQELERQINGISEDVEKKYLEIKNKRGLLNKFIFCIYALLISFIKHKNLKEYNKHSINPTMEQLIQKRHFLFINDYVSKRVSIIQNANYKEKLHIMYRYLQNKLR